MKTTQKQPRFSARIAEQNFSWFGFTVQKGFVYGRDANGYFVSSGARSRKDPRFILIYREKKNPFFRAIDTDRDNQYFPHWEKVQLGGSQYLNVPAIKSGRFHGNAAAIVSILKHGTLPSVHDIKKPAKPTTESIYQFALSVETPDEREARHSRNVEKCEAAKAARPTPEEPVRPEPSMAWKKYFLLNIARSQEEREADNLDFIAQEELALANRKR